MGNSSKQLIHFIQKLSRKITSKYKIIEVDLSLNPSDPRTTILSSKIDSIPAMVIYEDKQKVYECQRGDVRSKLLYLFSARDRLTTTKSKNNDENSYFLNIIKDMQPTMSSNASNYKSHNNNRITLKEQRQFKSISEIDNSTIRNKKLKYIKNTNYDDVLSLVKKIPRDDNNQPIPTTIALKSK